MTTIGPEDPPVDGVWRRAAESGGVRDALAAAVTVRRLEVVGAVASTQDVARVRAIDGAPVGTLVVAERQTAGRGRIGRGWDDDDRPGASLAATLLLELVDDASLLPHALGLAVLDAVAPWLGHLVALKWPNDVVARVDRAPRKVAGLLVERIDDGMPRGPVLLAGIGLNVDRRHAASAPDRTGVADLAGVDVDAAALLAGIVRGLDAALQLLAAGPAAVLERYRARSDTRGRIVRVRLPDGAELHGRADVDDEGRLVVESPLGRHTVLSGTVRDAGVDADGDEGGRPPDGGA